MRKESRCAAALSAALLAPVVHAQVINFNDQNGKTSVQSWADGFNNTVVRNIALPDNFGDTFTPNGGSVTATDTAPWVTPGFTIPGNVTSTASWKFSTTGNTATFVYEWSHAANLDGNGGEAITDGFALLSITPIHPVYFGVRGFFETAFTGPPGGSTDLSVSINNGGVLDFREQESGPGGARLNISEVASSGSTNLIGFEFRARSTAFGVPFDIRPDQNGSNGSAFGRLVFIVSTDPNAVPSGATVMPLMGLGLVATRRRR